MHVTVQIYSRNEEHPLNEHTFGDIDEIRESDCDRISLYRGDNLVALFYKNDLRNLITHEAPDEIPVETNGEDR